MIESVTASHKTALSIIELHPFAGSPFFDLSPPKESMECASPLSELVKCLWGLARKPLCSIYNLKGNVELLSSAKTDLRNKSADVKKRVTLEQEGGAVQCTNQVASWLDKVQEFEGAVDQVLQEAKERDRIKCLSRCLPRNCHLSYQLGERVGRMLIDASSLQTEEGQLGNLTMPLASPSVINIPMDKTVGLDNSLNKVWKWLMNEKQVGVIGLYGQGGVGKTTLMKRINEKLSPANLGFDIVIWVEVSKQVDEDSIRDAMRKRLSIRDESWKGWSPDERVHHLGEVLTRKKFVLLIDNVWARLDLSKIGVSDPVFENGSKVVFTTRSKEVCSQMGADKTSFKVQCLTTEEALVLFENNVYKSIINFPLEIQKLAKGIVQECGGLPLALITVGRAMAGIDKPHEWKDALTKLKKNPYKLSGMVEKVYHILELSYDRLNDSTLYVQKKNDSTLQRCFLYCCLFPEDYRIKLHDLIGLWIGEGLLGDTSDVYDLRYEGEHVLGRLNRACLLESGPDEGEYVKMHDVIRDMAIWIAREHGQMENKLLVIEKDEDMSAEMISKWEEATKVSIWGKWIQNINQIPSKCLQLETLFVRETKVCGLPSGFFDPMKDCLAVLNLSDNKKIESFPEGICNLSNLRYLNLSGTSISKLPKDIKNLTHLRWLLLDDIWKDILIPTGAIRSLPLNVFSHWNRGFLQSDQGKEEEMVEELECIQHLTDLSIRVRESSSAQKIFQSPNLQKRIRRARISDRNGNLTSIVITYSQTGSDSFSHLEELHLYRCTKLNEIKITEGVGRAANCSCFPNLVKVWVDSCRFSNLSWLVHAPELRKLIVENCDSMERIIGDGFAREESAASGLFSNLESLELTGLPKLTSICDQAQEIGRAPNCSCFPNLVEVLVKGCGLSDLSWLVHPPELRKLKVINCESMEKIIGDGFEREELAASGLFSRLESLELTGLPKLTSICDQAQKIGRAPNCSCFPNLVEVLVNGCGLSDLPWLVHAPKLHKLKVVNCESMEKIIGDGFARKELAASGLFSRLESLALFNLPKLTSICDQALSFPQGVSFLIRNCPGLRKLPLDSSSARGSFQVEGLKDWWAEFEWDPTALVTLLMNNTGPVEEMTFEEAARKVKDKSRYLTTIRFLPREGPSE